MPARYLCMRMKGKSKMYRNITIAVGYAIRSEVDRWLGILPIILTIGLSLTLVGKIWETILFYLH